MKVAHVETKTNVIRKAIACRYALCYLHKDHKIWVRSVENLLSCAREIYCECVLLWLKTEGNFSMISLFFSFFKHCYSEVPNFTIKEKRYKKKGLCVLGLGMELQSDEWFSILLAELLNLQQCQHTTSKQTFKAIWWPTKCFQRWQTTYYTEKLHSSQINNIQMLKQDFEKVITSTQTRSLCHANTISHKEVTFLT